MDGHFLIASASPSVCLEGMLRDDEIVREFAFCTLEVALNWCVGPPVLGSKTEAKRTKIN